MNDLRLRQVWGWMACSVVVFGLEAGVPLHPKFGFPVYTNAPSGRQLTGQHVPALTPALSPEEARKKFTLPPGFEIRPGIPRGGEFSRHRIAAWGENPHSP